MNINGLVGPGWLRTLETGVLSAIAPAAGFAAQSAGAAQSGSANSAASTVSGSPAAQFGPELLSALISAQSSPPSTADIAKGMISALDGDGDGSLSLSEVGKAITGGSTTPGHGLTSAVISDAFARLDTNADGQLSADELTAALNGVGSLFHHHRHHAAGTADTSAASSSGAAATDSASAPGQTA
jgi:hypothetical protein